VTAIGAVARISVSDGGVPKSPTESARVSTSGVEGDRQRNLALHGGPDRAVCLYAIERIRALRAEGHPVEAGVLGENVTVEGLEWTRVVPGTRLVIGVELHLEVTGYAAPCGNLRPFFKQGDYTPVSQKRHPGWSRVYARVLAPGPIRRGDPVRLIASPSSEAGAIA
jgi:MOSC domain-containing protein YiiM